LIQHTNGHILHRAHSFTDFGHQHMNGYGIAQPYGHKHSNSGGSHGYNDVSVAQEQIQSHMVVPRPPMHQHTYYIPEQGNPGVATMNTNPNVPIRQYQVAPHNQLRRSASYPPQNVASVQSSPGTYSSASSRSPAPQEGYYTHHPVQPTPAYNSQNASPIDQQPMMQYQQTPTMSQAQQHTLVSSAPLITQVQPQYQHWMAYQEPVQVSPAHCGDALYNPWPDKIDSYGHVLPSARIETL
jgi:metal regulatory transcription factor 1